MGNGSIPTPQNNKWFVSSSIEILNSPSKLALPIYTVSKLKIETPGSNSIYAVITVPFIVRKHSKRIR